MPCPPTFGVEVSIGGDEKIFLRCTAIAPAAVFGREFVLKITLEKNPTR
jgi:hypothetical protein